MKTANALVLGASLLVMAGGALAQNLNIAIQQAKRDNAQNNAEQQRIAGAANDGVAAPGGGAAPAAPVNPALQATLKNVASLQGDFAAIIVSTNKPDADQRNALLNDLVQAAQGTKATTDTVKKLADDLITAVAGQTKLAAAQQTKLARNVHALFNGAHLTSTQQQTLLDNVRKILTEAGATTDAVTDVVADLKTAATETK
jgi:hypothetical protein